MRKGVTSQTGKCDSCGRIIVKFQPAQAWMDKENFKEICDNGQPHRLAPFKEVNIGREN